MAAVLRAPPYHHSYAKPSILINTSPVPSSSYAPLPLSKHTLDHQSLSSSSSSASSNTDDAHSHSSHSWSSAHTPAPPQTAKSAATRRGSAPSARRIRFAPLPDPRALDDPDPSAELTLSPVSLSPPVGVCGDLISAKLDADLLSPASAAASCSSRQNSPSGLRVPLPLPGVHPGLNESTVTLPDPYASQITPTPSRAIPTPKPAPSNPSPDSWASTPKKLFRPFMRRASSPAPPTRTPAPAGARGLGIAAEDILTLGTISLFRTSSRGSTSASSTTASSSDAPAPAPFSLGGLGLGLGRWTSAGSYTAGHGRKGRGKEWFGSPLARTESAQSLGTPAARPARAATSPPTSPKGQKGRLKGTRMLNGRVYGGRGSAQTMNMFVTAKDEEPEFVEWGYGGMGSVKAGRIAEKDGGGGGTQWSRLQASGGGVGGGIGGGAGEEDDDGGGMGWVKRRKEMRERARVEAEEKATKAAADAAAAADPDAPKPAPEPAATPDDAPAAVQRPSTAASTATISPPAPALITATTKDRPATPVFLRTSSSTAAATRERPTTAASTASTSTLVVVPTAHKDRPATPKGTDDAPGLRAMSPLRMASFEIRRESPGPARQGGGSVSGSEDSEEGSEYEDGEDGEEEDDDEEVRKTALGAGVEKVSRHKEGKDGGA